MTYKYTKLTDKIGKIELDNYNRNDSELSFLEAKLVKESCDLLAVYGVLEGTPTNIVKNIKLQDGKYGSDPKFSIGEMPMVKLEIPLTITEKESNAGKKYKVGSVSENFIGNKLLVDFGDNAIIEATLNLGIDKDIITKYEEYLSFGEKGLGKANGILLSFYEAQKLDTLTILTDEIIGTASTVKQGNGSYGNKTYQKAETESEKLQARSEYVKRFLADNWDDSVDYKTVTFDSCLDVYKGRESVTKDKQGEFLMELLQTILP